MVIPSGGNAMLKKIHTWVCFALWTLWTVGLGATAISRFQYFHEKQWLFWDFVLPYNEIVQIISSIPFAPILCLLAFHSNKNAHKSNRLTVFLFILTAVYYVAYMTLFIRWTEG
jgi:amino acid permease